MSVPHAKSAYAFFCEEQRATSTEKLGFTETSKRNGLAWGALQDKSKYVALAEARKREVLEAKAALAAEGTTATVDGKKKKKDKDDGKTKRKREGGGAKKPLTGFILYSMETRPAIKEAEPELTFPEVAKRLGAAWKALSDEDKAGYKAKAEAKATNESAAASSSANADEACE